MSDVRDYTTFLTPLPHPGEHLREDFLRQYRMTPGALAKAMKLRDRTRVERLVREAQPVTPDTALRLGRVFGTSADLWMNLQAGHDLSTTAIAERDGMRAIDSLFPLEERATHGEAGAGLNEDDLSPAAAYIVRVEDTKARTALVIGRHLDMDEARALVEAHTVLLAEALPDVPDGTYPENILVDPRGVGPSLKVLASALPEGFSLPWRRWVYRVDQEAKDVSSTGVW